MRCTATRQNDRASAEAGLRNDFLVIDKDVVQNRLGCCKTGRLAMPPSDPSTVSKAGLRDVLFSSINRFALTLYRQTVRPASGDVTVHRNAVPSKRTSN